VDRPADNPIPRLIEKRLNNPAFGYAKYCQPLFIVSQNGCGVHIARQEIDAGGRGMRWNTGTIRMAGTAIKSPRTALNIQFQSRMTVDTAADVSS
jgi:hypothetical protein